MSNTIRVDMCVVESEKGWRRLLTTLRAAHAIHSYEPEFHTFTQIQAQASKPTPSSHQSRCPSVETLHRKSHSFSGFTLIMVRSHNVPMSSINVRFIKCC